MAKGYQLIQAQTLTSSASSVTFSNIPQNYTDLIVKISARSALAGTGTSRAIQLQINGDTTYANYRQRYIRTDDTGSAQSGAFLSSTGLKYYLYGLPNANVTANSFGAAELTFINYAGSSYKTFSVEAFAEGFHNPFTGTAGNSVTAALWVNTSPITTLVFNPDDSSFAAGSTFYLYGIGGTRATGGTITSDVNYTYHTFTSTSTFTPLEKIKNAEVLMVAGGGSGGYTAGNGGGGGGGAGGVSYTAGQTLYAGTSYTAVIGAGGATATSSTVLSGSNSQFSSLTAAVGGGGGGGAGATGGSGGGGGDSSSGGSATTGQGNAGGAGQGQQSAGGGGGAGTAGTAGYNNAGGGGSGPGGLGTSSYTYWHYATSTGVSSGGTYFIAGGGGGGNKKDTPTGAGAGGLGGGGAGGAALSAGTAGTANTGGGGGGASSNYPSGSNGGAGGSGLIIIRYPNV
jgi:hypothetical protein